MIVQYFVFRLYDKASNTVVFWFHENKVNFRFYDKIKFGHLTFKIETLYLVNFEFFPLIRLSNPYLVEVEVEITHCFALDETPQTLWGQIGPAGVGFGGQGVLGAVRQIALLVATTAFSKGRVKKIRLRILRVYFSMTFWHYVSNFSTNGLKHVTTIRNIKHSLINLTNRVSMKTILHLKRVYLRNPSGKFSLNYMLLKPHKK